MLRRIFSTLLILAPLIGSSQPFWKKTPNLKTSRFPSQIQKTQGGFDPDKITFGGNFGLTFGNTSIIDISPWVGYKIHEKVVPGIGLSYVYFRQKFQNTPVYQTSMLGARAFLRFDIAGPIFLYGELEAMNYDFYDRFSFEKERIWYFSQLVGGGYKQDFGDRSAYMISILYSLNSEDIRSPYYGSPLVFRVGFIIR